MFKFSFQPATERFPFLASNPKAILFLNLPHASWRNSLFFIAALLRIIFSTPKSIYFWILSIDRIPPPTSIFRSYLPTISWMTSKLTVLPVTAPSKSTMCKFLKPWSLYFPAWSTGEVSYSVLLSKSPLTNLTHFLSLMSIAGNIFILLNFYFYFYFPASIE